MTVFPLTKSTELVTSMQWLFRAEICGSLAFGGKKNRGS